MTVRLASFFHTEPDDSTARSLQRSDDLHTACAGETQACADAAAERIAALEEAAEAAAAEHDGALAEAEVMPHMRIYQLPMERSAMLADLRQLSGFLSA